MSYRASGPLHDSPSPGPGGERPERSRNAKAQAKHRAKRAAYVKGLEDDNLRLKAQLEAVMSQRGLSAMAGTSHGAIGSEPESRRLQEAELELARLRSENVSLRAQLERTGVSVPQHLDLYGGGIDRPHSASYPQRPAVDMHGAYPPPRSGSTSSNSESSISPAVQQPVPPMLPRSHQGGAVQPSQESMGPIPRVSSPAAVPGGLTTNNLSASSIRSPYSQPPLPPGQHNAQHATSNTRDSMTYQNYLSSGAYASTTSRGQSFMPQDGYMGQSSSYPGSYDQQTQAQPWATSYNVPGGSTTTTPNASTYQFQNAFAHPPPPQQQQQNTRQPPAGGGGGMVKWEAEM
ncbi:hypothetical protein DACRYDRAFT_22606 [Dacryopinax primogenitus]|uniref:BZIP domain-containing protein n=1 Tax=Dacryopinax primogenitus (strain DJM 731) TaxID=1858805 RepID=M5G6N4_DACPD|nr:uncharacterized protein DACRYDRAFT_22606 [Dacryopinax primogenitus]EJU01482.1 hypothetical protein DACRYDRAFT_22606 [Dacryopinax primogenitus]